MKRTELKQIIKEAILEAGNDVKLKPSTINVLKTLNEGSHLFKNVKTYKWSIDGKIIKEEIGLKLFELKFLNFVKYTGNFMEFAISNNGIEYLKTI